MFRISVVSTVGCLRLLNFGLSMRMEFCEVCLYARFKLFDDFREDNFYYYFFNARRIQITFLGRRSVNMSVKWLNVPVQLSKFEVVSRLGLKISLFNPGVSSLL